MALNTAKCFRCKCVDFMSTGYTVSGIWFHWQCPVEIDTNKTATEVRMQQEALKTRLRQYQEEYDRAMDRAIKESIRLITLTKITSGEKIMTTSTPTPNTNVKHQQEIINAYLEGKVIETYIGGHWIATFSKQVNFFFNFERYAYRIKPEPREFWIGLAPSGQLVWASDSDLCKAAPGHTKIKVREVLGD